MRIPIILAALIVAQAVAEPLAPVFVSTDTVQQLILNPVDGWDVKIIDCSVGDTNDAILDYHQSHLPGAVFIDLRYFRNQSSPYPFMLTSQDQFKDQMKLLNIKKSTRVILYDKSPGYYATRVYWMMRTFGIYNASVLDGGFNKWQSENRTLESTLNYGTQDDYDYVFLPELYRSFEQILVLEKEITANTTTEQIADARPKATYDKGHIIGAIDSWWKLLQNDDGTVKSPQEIWNITGSQGIDWTKPITTTCQSGISATWLFASFQHAGNMQTAVYDGSWAEYSDRKNKTQPTVPGIQLSKTFFGL